MSEHLQSPSEYLNIEVKQLSDLTGQLSKRDESVPKEIVQWLCAVFPGAREEQYMAMPPPGSFGMLLPKTKVVLFVPRFLWGTIQAIVSSVGIYGLRGDVLNQGLVGLGLGNALRDILDSFVRLKELEGEYCTFSALINVHIDGCKVCFMPRDTHSVWQAHDQYRQACPVTACRFHNDGCCLSESGLENILKNLKERGLVKETNGVWERSA